MAVCGRFVQFQGLKSALFLLRLGNARRLGQAMQMVEARALRGLSATERESVVMQLLMIPRISALSTG